MTIAPKSGSNLYPNYESAHFVVGPDEESFDEKYNKRQEFLLSLVSAILVHVLVGATLVVLLVYLIGAQNGNSKVTISLVKLTGLDETGSGSPGSGSDLNPPIKTEGIPDTGPTTFQKPEKLPDVKIDQPDVKIDIDPLQKLPLPDQNTKIHDELNNKLQQILSGKKPGSGQHAGSGNNPTPGTGPGGEGADSTQARNLRWVLRFNVTDGQDYLDQLKAMGAEILIPLADQNYLIVPDLNKPKDYTSVTEEGLQRLAKKIKFSDSRSAEVKAFCRALGLDNLSPKEFWAFFPKELEAELSKKELGYANRRPEDIEETVFRVTLRDGKYEIKAVEQKVKR
jgi:hypothetical protein